MPVDSTQIQTQTIQKIPCRMSVAYRSEGNLFTNDINATTYLGGGK